MKNILIILLTLIFSSGCVSTLDTIAGVGIVEVNKSDYDGSTEVTLSKTRPFTR